MQCAWRNFTRRALGEIARPWLRPSGIPRPYVSNRMFSTPRLASHEQPTLTPAQLGREASHVIRFLLSQQNVADSYTIVNSIRYAGLINKASSLPGVTNLEQFRSVALAFSPDVSPRLPTHTLLHGLIRMRMLEEASNLANQMIEAGITVRCRSLEVLYKTIALGAQPLPPTLGNVSNHPGTRFALRILELTRESRQRRSRNMFKTLLKLCIINGEIIVASLIFGTLLRDWQAQQLASTPPAAQLTPDPESLRFFVTDMCSVIDSHLLSNRTDSHSTLAFAGSLQALANLAYALDHRLFPSRNLTAIICSMYRCPKGEETVWVPDKGEVQAHAYFHGVLARLMNDLPTKSSGGIMPPLDMPTSCTLLHYALRHRKSVRLAEKVHENMFHNQLEPNDTTINILERAEHLLRTSKIKGKCLELLDRRQTNKFKHGLTTQDNYALSTRISRLIDTDNSHAVVDALDDILPGLFAHRATEDLGLLKRAIYLGPVVFTDILNALLKTGRTGKAERVWHIARRAEEMSWEFVRKDNEVKPWCLPVHAYTIMIKLYAKEAKKARSYFVAQGQGVDLPLNPKSVRIVGWGRDPRNGRKMKVDEKPRHYLGRQLAIKVYRAVSDAPHEVQRRVAELRERQQQSQGLVRVVIGRRQLEAPHPDARLFNAILDVVGRHPHMTRRRPDKKRYARRLRASLARFAAGHHSQASCDPALPQIAADMTRAGFSVPLLYRRLLVGTGWRDQGWRRYERDRSVWAVATRTRPRTNTDVDAVCVHPNIY